MERTLEDSTIIRDIISLHADMEERKRDIMLYFIRFNI